METIKPQILQKISMRRKLFSVLWFIPFISFLVGYLITGYFLRKIDLETPNVLGKSIQEALPLLSEHHLSIRLLQQREDSLLPEGTILDQLPRPGQKIRPNQSVFVTIAAKGRLLAMPDLWGKKRKEASALMAKQGIETKEIGLHTSFSRGMCIAQSPSAGRNLTARKALVYVSDGASPICIMPRLTGAMIGDVQAALAAHAVRAEIIHDQPMSPDHNCAQCKIIEQQPVPGAIIDTSHALQVQLKVASA